MSYCINPNCNHRQNRDEEKLCQVCGTSLLIKNRYRLIEPLRKLDSQHHTEIWKVDDSGTLKVMKVLNTDQTKLIELFEREANVLQSLRHPAIPKIEIDEGYFTFIPNNLNQELYCLVMEYIEGENLEQWVKKNGKINQYQALNWLKQILSILRYLRERGIFHRDIKPLNIIRKPDDRLVLIDFGSVRYVTKTYLAKISWGKDIPEIHEITKIISEGYTAPEQINGEGLPQSDFYALGRTFVHLLTGKPPTHLPYISVENKLIWRDQAFFISKKFVNLIDELMSTDPIRRQNAEVYALGLNPISLRWQSWMSFLFSSKGIGLIITLGLLSTVIYWFSTPFIARHYSNLGRKALEKEQLKDAHQNLKLAVFFNPKQAIFRSDLALTCKLLQNWDCALSQYKKAMELTSDTTLYLSIHYNLALLYESIFYNFKHQATTDDDPFIDPLLRMTENSEDSINNAIRQYYIIIKYFTKKTEQNILTEKDKLELGVYSANNYARLQILEKKNNLEAIQEITKALNWSKKIHLNNTEKRKILQSTLYKNLGWAFFQEGKLQKAKKYLEKSIELEIKKKASTHCLLAKTLQQIDKQEAIKSWKKCLDYDSQSLPEVEAWQLDAKQYINLNIVEGTRQ